MRRILFAAALALAPVACRPASEMKTAGSAAPVAVTSAAGADPKASQDPASAAPGGADSRPAATPPAKPADAVPPLPHADRKDDPTIVVPGDPPLTRGELDRNLDLWEWALDLDLTDRQRAQWQKGWVAAVAQLKGNAKAERLSTVRANIQLWEGIGKLDRLQRELNRLQQQAVGLDFLRSSAEPEHTLLLRLYEQAHKPGGERNPVLVASDPPLTQDMMNLYRTAMDYVLDLHMTDRQRDEFQRAFIEDWKKNDPQQYAKGIESWRKPLARKAYSRRIWRAQQRPPLLGNLPKSKDESDRWLLAAYHAAQVDHKPGSERNPILVEGNPPLTRDEVDDYCVMVEGVLDFSLIGGLTDAQRGELQGLLVKDWKGMDRAARQEFLHTLEKWPSHEGLRAHLRAAPSSDERSQYLLEVCKKVQKVQKMDAEVRRLIQRSRETTIDAIRNAGPNPGHYEYNSATGRYDRWVEDR